MAPLSRFPVCVRACVCAHSCTRAAARHLAARDYDLRGCIGTLSPLPVEEIVDYALKSAFEDSRFEPLTESELPQLKISVSLLVNYEPAATPVDWVVGKHGIILTFRADGRTYRGTFLPEVAPEQGWNQDETLAGLVRKAGYRRSPIPKEVRDSMRVERFQSVKGSMTYEDWRRWTEEATASHARLA